MQAVLASFFVLTGAAFTLIAAVGILRMPDLYCRMHTATKAGAFGSACLLLGLAIALPVPRVILQSLLIIVFFYITAPVAAHLIGRVALRRDMPLWKAPSGPSEPAD